MAYPELFGPPKREGVATTDDGARLFWQVFGSAPQGWPTLVCCNGLGCSTFFWHYLARYFSSRTEVLVWDYRGHGDSSTPSSAVQEMNVGRMVADLHAVVTHAKMPRSVFIGHSMGVQVILEYYRRHSEAVAALVPVLGTFGHAVDTFFDSRWVGRVFPALYHLVRRVPAPLQWINRYAARSRLTLPLASLTGMVNGTQLRPSDLDAYMSNLAALDMRVFFELAHDMGKHTCEDILRVIRVPVLIIGGERDIYTPLWLSEKMHREIPESELLMLPGGSHAGLVEQPELVNLRLEKFIRERGVHAHHESATARVLDAWGEERLKRGGAH
jgi:pimeloyl-ACP methyl ester carboxylesterase